MKFAKVVSVVIVAALAAGCASVGNEQLRNETETSIQGKIIEGQIQGRSATKMNPVTGG